SERGAARTCRRALPAAARLKAAAESPAGTVSLHDALPISWGSPCFFFPCETSAGRPTGAALRCSFLRRTRSAFDPLTPILRDSTSATARRDTPYRGE